MYVIRYDYKTKFEIFLQKILPNHIIWLVIYWKIEIKLLTESI